MQPLDPKLFQTSNIAPTRLFDTHPHLGSDPFANDLKQVIHNAQRVGVERMIAIGAGTGSASNERALALAKTYPFIAATVGIHPHEANLWSDNMRLELERLVAQAQPIQPVAIGEIGLDYHYNFAPPPKQRQAFVEQLAWAKQMQLPCIIHTREAHEDTVAILKEQQEYLQACGGIIHCFSESPQAAQRYLELGMHLSFSGIITFAKALDVQAALQATPMERLLLETDCPYLAPHPHRSKRNEPACLSFTALQAAKLKGVDSSSFCQQVWQNSCQLLAPDLFAR